MIPAMDISSTNHLSPGAGSLPATANRLLHQAQQALGIAGPGGAPRSVDTEVPVGIQDSRNPSAPGIQSRANGIDRTLDAPVAGNNRPEVTPAEREKLVLRPSAVSVEDRLSQVMSLEDVQRLLLVRSPMPDAPGLNRQPGQLLDSRA